MELVLEVLRYLTVDQGVVLRQVNRQFSDILNPAIYRYYDERPVRWALANADFVTIRKAVN
jgi:hypothetical protein